MKKFSVTASAVLLIFVFFSLFFLTNCEGLIVSRDKKKLAYTELEEHVVVWAKEQIENVKCCLEMLEDDESRPEDQKESIYIGISETLKSYVDLLKPISHKEKDLVKWMKKFIADHPID